MQVDPLIWSGKSEELPCDSVDVFAASGTPPTDDARKLGEVSGSAEFLSSTDREIGGLSESPYTLPGSSEMEGLQVTELSQLVTEQFQATEVKEVAPKDFLEARMEVSTGEPQGMKEKIGVVAQSMVVPALAKAMKRVREKEAAQVALEDVVGELATYVDQIFLSISARLEALERRCIDGTVLAASHQLQQLTSKPNLQELIEELESKFVRTEAKLMCGIETSNRRWKDQVQQLWDAVDSHTHDINIDGTDSCSSVHPIEIHKRSTPDLTSAAVMLHDDAHLNFQSSVPPLSEESHMQPPGKQVENLNASTSYSSVTQSLTNGSANVPVTVQSGSLRVPAPVATPGAATNGSSIRVGVASNGGILNHGGSCRVAHSPASPALVARATPVTSSRLTLTNMSGSISCMPGAPGSPVLMPRSPATPAMMAKSPSLVPRALASPQMVTRVPSTSPVMVSRAVRSDPTMSPGAPMIGIMPKVSPMASPREMTDDFRLITSGSSPHCPPTQRMETPTLAAIAKFMAGAPESGTRSERALGSIKSPRAEARTAVPHKGRNTLPPKVTSLTTPGLGVSAQPQRFSLPTRQQH